GVSEPALDRGAARAAVGSDHQAGVEHSGERSSFTGKLLKRWEQDFVLHPLEESGSADGDRAVCTDAAGVGSVVSLAQPLVILRRWKQLDCVPIGDREERQV